MDKDSRTQTDASNKLENSDVEIEILSQAQSRIYSRLTDQRWGRRSLSVLIFCLLAILVPFQTFFVSTFLTEVHSYVSTIPDEQIKFSYFILPLAIIMFTGIYNCLFLYKFNTDLHLFRKISDELKLRNAQSKLDLDITQTHLYNMLNLFQSAYLGGTLLVWCLYYLFPDRNQLEPLSLIYGFGSALTIYLRSTLKIPNPLERYFNG